MNPLSLPTNVAIAKYQKEQTIGGQRQPLADSTGVSSSLANLVDTIMPQSDNAPGDLAPELHVLRNLSPGKENIGTYDGNSQRGSMTQQVTTPDGQGFRYTDFKPDAIDSLLVNGEGANRMHIDRKDPAQSYVEVLNQPWQIFAGRPTQPPAGPDPVSQLTTTPSGLQYAVLKPGEGPAAEKWHPVLVDYSGWLSDGTRFDSSLGRPEPFGFNVGAGQVIKGWNEGVEGMKVGEKRHLTIPPELGYGGHPVGPIPANSPLTFDVQLLATQ